jgi:hypothetical protein
MVFTAEALMETSFLLIEKRSCQAVEALTKGCETECLALEFSNAEELLTKHYKEAEKMKHHLI